METWLTDVKQLRIPRPKFGGSPPSTRHNMRRPYEPPRDYNMASANDDTASSHHVKLQTATEELRQALHDKL